MLLYKVNLNHGEKIMIEPNICDKEANFDVFGYIYLDIFSCTSKSTLNPSGKKLFVIYGVCKRQKFLVPRFSTTFIWEFIYAHKLLHYYVI